MLQRKPGDVLQGVLLTGQLAPWPRHVRANRVHVYRCIDPEHPPGLARGELFHLIGGRVEYDLSRDGYWTVLDYLPGRGLYRVLHIDEKHKVHDVLINISDIENMKLFRKVNGK